MKKYTEKDIKEGMKLRCTDNNGYVRWTTGEVYEVKKTDEGVLYIEDVEGGCRSYIDAILFRLNHNDESAIFEVIEEKPVRFAKVTRLWPSDRGLIEVGHCYKVLKELSEGRVRIYLNSRLGNHVLHPDQFVFVDEPPNDGEKDAEELDVEAKILADIEQLKTEAEYLFAKRDRANEQALNLSAKARKLEDSLEALREYM